MIRTGQIVPFAFPDAGGTGGKLRPALVIQRTPGPYDDWLICMISSQLRQKVEGIDEVINLNDEAFPNTGLKLSSVIRATRLAVVASDLLQGSIGMLHGNRYNKIVSNIAAWISGEK